MPCDLCKKKGIPIKCNYCIGKYCSRCINLDQHKCDGIEDYKKYHREQLEKKLVIVKGNKVIAL